MTEPIFILKGVAGSHAQGLASENSDVDMHGIFSFRTSDFWRLERMRVSINKSNPDEAYTELESFLKLALKSNFTALETLWLPKYEEIQPVWGAELIDMRESFLSAPEVKRSYLSYGMGQLKTIETLLYDFRGRERFNPHADGGTSQVPNPSEVRLRKHCKHLIRLLSQGIILYTTGEFHVDVPSRSFYIDTLPHWTFTEVIRYAQAQIEELSTTTSALPELPNTEMAIEYLRQYRISHI